MPEKPLTIVQLKASNVKRLVAVDIKPDGEVVVLGGKNGAGKSSVLDSIAYALGGERLICREPLRRGAEKGEIDVDLGEFRVRRTFTKEGGGTLSVLSPDGARYPSPQALLDKVCGSLSFDPLAFAAMPPAKQSETLRTLLGLDFSRLDADRAAAFSERTIVNRDGKALVARFDATPFYADAPKEEVSTADILAEQEAAIESARKQNAAIEAKRAAAREARMARIRAAQDVTAAEKAAADADAEVARWQEVAAGRRKVVAAAQKALDSATKNETDAGAAAADLRDIDQPNAADLAPFRSRLAAVEATNAKVRANAEHERMRKRVEEKRAESAALTAKIEAADKAKADAIAAAKMPVDGLGFDPAGGVTMNGLPFDQASHAERLRASVAIGLAMHPRLKVLLVRDASLLDEDGMRLVAEMAAAAGAQFWLERVGRDEHTTVEIADGAVVADAVPA